MTVTPNHDEANDVHWLVWRRAARTKVIHQAIERLYEQVGQATEARGPICWASGRCCHFDSYGHRLYVTGLEIAWVLEQAVGLENPARIALDSHPQGTCPFQINRLCSIHTIRPLGCRLFFCQQDTESWQQDLYESFQARLRALHEKHDLPYRYMDWQVGLHKALALI